MNEHINLETSNKTRIYISSGCKTFPSKSQPTWNHLVTLLQRPKQSVFWEGCGNKTVTKWSGLSGRSASWKHGCGNTLTFRSFWPEPTCLPRRRQIYSLLFLLRRWPGYLTVWQGVSWPINHPSSLTYLLSLLSLLISDPPSCSIITNYHKY